MTITTEQTRAIHEHYNSLVSRDGISIPYTMTLHFRWEAWLAHGFTSDDLRLVIGYIRRRIKERKREKESLLPRNLLASADKFAEDLSMARAESRKPVIDQARASVLVASGRSGEPETRPARSVADVLAGERAFQDFKRLKEIL